MESVHSSTEHITHSMRLLIIRPAPTIWNRLFNRSMPKHNSWRHANFRRSRDLISNSRLSPKKTESHIKQPIPIFQTLSFIHSYFFKSEKNSPPDPSFVISFTLLGIFFTSSKDRYFLLFLKSVKSCFQEMIMYN